MKRYFTLLILVLVSTLIHSTIYTVKQDGTGDFTAIQEAIDFASNDDIVRVYPGTYYGEIYIGKPLTLESLYASTQDTTYIHNTRLIAQLPEIVVFIGSRHSDESHLFDFTVTIDGFYISNNQEGIEYMDSSIFSSGILVSSINANIQNNIITKNFTSQYGAGIFAAADPNNMRNLYLANNQIFENKSFDCGAGIYIYGGFHIIFDSVNRNSVFNNQSATMKDIVIYEPRMDVLSRHIYLDKGSRIVSEFEGHFIGRPALKVATDIVDIQREHFPPVNANLYVSPTGDDRNTGLSQQEALKTINYATSIIASDSLNPKTIYLAPGVYSRENGQEFPFHIPAFTKLMGSGKNATILDEGNIGVAFAYSAQNGYIEAGGFSVLNVGTPDQDLRPIGGSAKEANFYDITLNNCYSVSFLASHSIKLNNIEFTDSFGRMGIGGADIEIENLYINNVHSGSGVLSIYGGADMKIDNLVLTNSSSRTIMNIDLLPFYEGYEEDGRWVLNNILVANNSNVNGAYIWESPIVFLSGDFPVIFNNSTIAHNTAIIPQHGIGLYNTAKNLSLHNTILYNPAIHHEFIPLNMFLPYTSIKNSLFSSLHEEFHSIATDCIEGDPLFAGEFDPHLDKSMTAYYRLHETSPCIDTGIEDVTDLFIPSFDLAGNHRIWNDRIDMGAFEYGATALNPPSLSQYSLSNYPNPFNPETTISFTISPSPMKTTIPNVSISIYNIRGQRIRTLVNDHYPAGTYKVVWNGTDDTGRNVGSGVYFYRMTTDEYSAVKRMVLMK